MYSQFFGRFLLLLLFFFSAPAHAEQKTGEQTQLAAVTTMNSVMVTTTRTERRIEEVPVKTEVVTREEIEKNHAKNLAEALRYVPGVQLKPIHGKTGTAVWLQGFSGDRVLILIDGNPVSPSTGSTVDVTQIAVGDVERIEIVKGAVSAMYGTSAMGGVINIITAEPEHQYAASVEGSGGGWGEQNIEDSPIAKRYGKVDVSTRQQNWYGQVIAEVTDSDGWKATDDGAATEGWAGQKSNISAKSQVKLPKELVLTLMPRYYHEDVTNILDNYVPGIGNRPKDKVDLTDTYHLSAVLEQPLNHGDHWKMRVMWEDFNNEARQDVQATSYIDQKRVTDLTHQEAAFQYDLSLDEHLVTTGIAIKQDVMNVSQFKYQQAEIVEVDNETANAYEFYLQDSWFAAEHLEFLPGFRVHYDPDFGTHLSPMINGLWSTHDWLPGQLNIRAGVGNGYRVPNLKERFYTFDHSHLGYMVLGNPDLSPESSISYQAGLQWLMPYQGELDLHIYYNDATDLIETAYDADESANTNLAIYRYQNYSKVSTKGAELSFRQPWTNWLRTDMSYTYLEARNEENGLLLPQRPQHEAKVSADFSMTDNTTLIINYRYESEQYVDADNLTESPAYGVWDLKFNQNLNRQWSWYLGGDNLLSEQREFDGRDFRPEEGRYLYAGLKWQWYQDTSH